MNERKNLLDLSPGERSRVTELTMSGGMRRRLLDIGLTPNTEIECLGRSPFGDPSAYLIRGAVIAIRAKDGAHILIKRQ